MPARVKGQCALSRERRRKAFRESGNVTLERRKAFRDGAGRVEKNLFIQNAAGKMVLRPVDDESRLDERRASVGLEPSAAYVRRFETP